MRSPNLRVLGASVAIWLGSVKGMLDLVGHWDAAMHIKAVLPSVLASPFISPVILVIGFGVLYWTTKRPLIVAAVFDAHGNAYERPRHPVLKYGLYSFLVAAVCVAVLVGGWSYIDPPEISTAPPPMLPVDKSAITPNVKVAKKTARFERKEDTPCTPKEGKFYSDYVTLPGGPRLQRPLLVLNTGTYPVLVVAINEVNLLVFELVITNRGEASIAKNWELCLVHDGKPIRFNPAKIPPEGIPVSATERITPDKSLVDNAIRVPIEHAHTAGGWVVFKVSDTALIDGWKNGKEPFKGSIQFKDYLDHFSSFDFDMDSTSKVLDTYVPGAPR